MASVRRSPFDAPLGRCGSVGANVIGSTRARKVQARAAADDDATRLLARRRRRTRARPMVLELTHRQRVGPDRRCRSFDSRGSGFTSTSDPGFAVPMSSAAIRLHGVHGDDAVAPYRAAAASATADLPGRRGTDDRNDVQETALAFEIDAGAARVMLARRGTNREPTPPEHARCGCHARPRRRQRCGIALRRTLHHHRLGAADLVAIPLERDGVLERHQPIEALLHDVWRGRDRPWSAAGVPGRGENWNMNAVSNRARAMTSSVAAKSSSVSPGNPTITSVDAGEIRACASPHHPQADRGSGLRCSPRCMAARMRSEPDWSGKWMCSHTAGVSAIASGPRPPGSPSDGGSCSGCARCPPHRPTRRSRSANRGLRPLRSRSRPYELTF